MAENFCPNCGSFGMKVFYELRGIPVHSVLLMPTLERALSYPKGDITLGFCQKCGFISNMVFDPDVHEYSSKCEDKQGFSPTFNAFARGLATRLIDRYDLHDKDINEIGCGKGEFLSLLCELGNNRGVGFDPAYIEGRYKSKAKDRITFIKDFYSEKYGDYKANLICCRMTLEHIYNTSDFVNTVRCSIGPRSNTIVFFQVPDVTRILRECAFQDIYYEHCSYFSPGSLARLFCKYGFELLNLETDYGDQYLMIEAKPVGRTPKGPLPQENDLEKMEGYIMDFQEKFQRKLRKWQAKLHEFHTKGRRAVLWGSGSKGGAFLTTLKIRDEIKYVVDINPYRQGTYMAGTGQLIVVPEFLREYKPDIVIVMNSVYREEIRQDLNQMSLNPELLSV